VSQIFGGQQCDIVCDKGYVHSGNNCVPGQDGGGPGCSLIQCVYDSDCASQGCGTCTNPLFGNCSG
jgi:hypothetical protein